MEDSKRQQLMAKIKKLRLLDDFFMTRFFEGNIECTELVLRIILKKDDLRVVRVETQATIKNLVGRGARLDVLAVDAEGKYYDIEVQRAKDGADFRRARFNSSMLDMIATKEGDKYEDVVDTYVIFITEDDVFKAGHPVYEIGRIVLQTGQMIDDGAHEIYVNAAYVGDDPIGRLMADFRNQDYCTMNYELLRQRSEFLKEEDKGGQNMCAFSEELLAEGRAEGEARGRIDGRIAAIVENVRNMMDSLKWTAQAVMDAMKISPADRPAILAAL